MNERGFRPGSFVAGIVVAVVFVGGGSAAYAANGGSLLLGKGNTAAKTTKLSSSKTPLSLSASHGRAPLAVNSSGKVAKLNVDKLDGLDSTAFVKTTAPVGVVRAQGAFQDVNGDGTADALFAMATCPAGTKLTGGGVENFTGFATLAGAPTTDRTSWLVASLADGTNTADDLVASALCFSPKGTIPGLSFYTTRKAQIPAELVARVTAVVAKR
jgi:hypothetical protein